MQQTPQHLAIAGRPLIRLKPFQQQQQQQQRPYPSDSRRMERLRDGLVRENFGNGAGCYGAEDRGRDTFYPDEANEIRQRMRRCGDREARIVDGDGVVLASQFSYSGSSSNSSSSSSDESYCSLSGHRQQKYRTDAGDICLTPTLHGRQLGVLGKNL